MAIVGISGTPVRSDTYSIKRNKETTTSSEMAVVKCQGCAKNKLVSYGELVEVKGYLVEYISLNLLVEN